MDRVAKNVDELLDVVQGKENIPYDEHKIISSLARIGEPAVEPLIAAISNDDNSMVREVVVRALGAINNERAIEVLIQGYCTITILQFEYRLLEYWAN